MVVRKLILIGLGLITLAACQKSTTKAQTKTLPAVRSANGTVYDLKCLKSKSPQSMAACEIDQTTGARVRGLSPVYNDGSEWTYDQTYFIWQMPYFNEGSLCQWLWGMDACYGYFGYSWLPQGPSCDVAWIFQYQDLPQTGAQNCGWYWNPWYTYPYFPQQPWWGGGYPWGGQWPQQPELTCDQIKNERDWFAGQASYCNHDSQCEIVSTVSKWGACSPPAINTWLRGPELDYWTDLYESECLNGTETPVCPMTLVACEPPKCVLGRCQHSCP